MMRRPWMLALMVAVGFWGCGSHGEGHDHTSGDEGQHAAEDGQGTLDVDPEDPTLLPRPYTSEQIRDEWLDGLTIDIEYVTAEGTTFERLTVTSWDENGCVIQSTAMDANGNATAEPRLQPATWTELRDHASFPATTAKLEEVTRDTPLGRLDGRLYTVPDADAGTVTEFFFADDHPGAPVHMVTRQDGETTMEMTQIARSRP